MSTSRLYQAITRGATLAEIEYLVQRGEDIDEAVELHDELWTPLDVAVQRQRFDLVRYFVEQGCDLQATRALPLSGEVGPLETVKYLLSHGAPQVDAALLKAAGSGRLDIVQYLASDEGNANVRAVDEAQDTGLHLSSAAGAMDVVELFLEWGIPVDALNGFGSTALMLASKNGRMRAVEYLVDRGANVRAKNYKGSTAVEFASQRGHAAIVRYLLNLGAVHDPSCLLKASENGHLEVVRLLIQEGVEVDARDPTHGWTAVGRASSRSHWDVAYFLVEKGADVNSQDNLGWSPLLWAIWLRDMESAGVLIDAGADPTMTNNNGENAWDIALSAGGAELVTELQAHIDGTDTISPPPSSPPLLPSSGNDGNQDVILGTVVAAGLLAVGLVLWKVRRHCQRRRATEELQKQQQEEEEVDDARYLVAHPDMGEIP